MADSYVCSKAKIKCSCGDKISTLTVYPDRTIWLTGEPQANISDHISMRNIAPFGKCHTTRYPATGSATAANHGKLTPMPCVPNTPFSWMGGKDDVVLKGQPALLKSSTCKCVWGGTITITFDGQTAGEPSGIPYLPKEEFPSTPAVEESPMTRRIIRNGLGDMTDKLVTSDKNSYKKTIISETTASLVLPGYDKWSDNIKKGILRGANALPDSIPIDDRLKLANHTRDIAHALNIKIDAPMTIDKADKQSANPKFAPGTGYGVNCATVAATYVLRLQGLNVTAKAKNEDNKLNDWLSQGNSFKIWKNVDGSKAKPSTYVDWMKNHTTDNKNPITKMTPNLYKRFIEDNTKEEGVYIITVGWKPNVKGERSGHATIIQKWRDENGELHLSYIEPQVYNEKVGVKQSIDNLVKEMDEEPEPHRGIMRVDNKMFDTQYVSLFETSKPSDENTKRNENTGKDKIPS